MQRDDANAEEIREKAEKEEAREKSQMERLERNKKWREKKFGKEKLEDIEEDKVLDGKQERGRETLPSSVSAHSSTPSGSTLQTRATMRRSASIRSIYRGPPLVMVRSRTAAF